MGAYRAQLRYRPDCVMLSYIVEVLRKILPEVCFNCTMSDKSLGIIIRCLCLQSE